MVLIQKQYKAGPIRREVTPEKWAQLKAMPNQWGWTEIKLEPDPEIKSEPKRGKTCA